MFDKLNKPASAFLSIAVAAFLFLALPTGTFANDQGKGKTHDHGKWKFPRGRQSSSPAGGASIKILSLRNGDTVAGGKNLVVEYEINPGDKGDHFHYFLDGEQLGSIRSRAGRLDFGKVPSGKHVITFKIANVAHILIGVEKSVTFDIK